MYAYAPDPSHCTGPAPVQCCGQWQVSYLGWCEVTMRLAASATKHTL